MRIIFNLRCFIKQQTHILGFKLIKYYRCLVANIDINTGDVGDNFKELPCFKSVYIGEQNWINPPLFLLHEDK